MYVVFSSREPPRWFQKDAVGCLETTQAREEETGKTTGEKTEKWVITWQTNSKKIGKSSQNIPILVQKFYGGIPCVLCVQYIKSCYSICFDCSVHVSGGFLKKSLDRLSVGWALFIFWGFFCIAKPLTTVVLSLVLSDSNTGVTVWV